MTGEKTLRHPIISLPSPAATQGKVDHLLLSIISSRCFHRTSACLHHTITSAGAVWLLAVPPNAACRRNLNESSRLPPSFCTLSATKCLLQASSPNLYLSPPAPSLSRLRCESALHDESFSSPADEAPSRLLLCSPLKTQQVVVWSQFSCRQAASRVIGPDLSDASFPVNWRRIRGRCSDQCRFF